MRLCCLSAQQHAGWVAAQVGSTHPLAHTHLGMTPEEGVPRRRPPASGRSWSFVEEYRVFVLLVPRQSADNRRSWRLNCHSEGFHMDNQRQPPQAGGVESKLAASAIQSEHNCELRQVRREPGDSVIATKFRMEENSDVPSKVPRFQYVDFPSLHQCIKQISVPPLEGWLASSPPGKVTANHSSSAKDKGPKYKYVDYPSLHHCIQQLSVPPLETWSSKPTKPSPGLLQTVTVQCPSQGIRDRKKNKEMKENRVSGSAVHVPVPEQAQAVLQHMQDACFSSDCVSISGSDSNQELDKATERKEKSLRPSVISLVCTERKKHRVKPEERSERGKPTAQLEQPIDLQLIFPLGQQIFTDSVQH